MSVGTTATRRLGVASLSLAMTITAGCSLFSSLEIPKATQAERQVLPPLKAPSDAILLQIVFIERPADDPLVQSLLWQELDQVGAIPPETRKTLEANGLRVGQAGAHPPPTLQKLLGLTEELVSHLDDDQSWMRGRRLGLRSGQETDIQTLDFARDATIRYVLNGKEETGTYQQLLPFLKVRPVRVQEGWVRLDLSPEIHHGEARLRHTPTDEGWTLRGGQNRDVRELLKFPIMLNNKEFAVISAVSDQPDSLGARMFLQEQDGRRAQRLLVVRLASSGRAEVTEEL